MDNMYIASMRINTSRYEQELIELQTLLQQSDLSNLEYRAAERSLQISIEACIGIAKHWAKHKTGHRANDAYQSFEQLSQTGEITLDDLKNWRKVIGLRNALVHDYLNIDAEIVRSIIKNSFYKQLFDFIKIGLIALENIE